MKKIKILIRTLIVFIIVGGITTTIAIEGKRLNFAEKLPDKEICEECAFGTFVCLQKVKLDPCRIQDGLVNFYVTNGILVFIMISIFLIILNEYGDFKFIDWIKGN